MNTKKRIQKFRTPCARTFSHWIIHSIDLLKNTDSFINKTNNFLSQSMNHLFNRFYLFRSKASTYVVTSNYQLAYSIYNFLFIELFKISITLKIVLLCWMSAYLYSNTSNRYILWLIVTTIISSCNVIMWLQKTYSYDSFIHFYAFLLFWCLTGITFHFGKEHTFLRKSVEEKICLGLERHEVE